MPRVACFWVERTGDGAWRRPGTGEVMPYPGAFGVGALWDAYADWREQEIANGGKRYHDGLCPVVLTPGGEWAIDGCAYDAGARKPCPWTRVGDPRAPATFSVTPSIHFPGRYHGWLRNGELIDA